jgi:predicted DNA-binding transcriptional regulator AlpA
MSLSSLIPDDAPAEVNAATLARWLGVSPSTVTEWAKRGMLPEPLRLGPKIIRFNVAEVRVAVERLLQPSKSKVEV